MARLPRFFIPGHPLHVILRGNNRQRVFANIRDYTRYLGWLRDAAHTHGCAIHAYVLMPNHIHLLATPGHEQSLPKTLQSLGRRYVQHFNQTHDRTGTLWEGRYRATLVDTEAYLLPCYRYIEGNPVRAENVTHPSQYRWSSYHFHAEGRADQVLTPHAIYRRLGRTPEERQKAYRALFRKQLSGETLDEIREATNKAWVLGRDRFRKKIATMTERRVEPLPRGRPRGF